MRLWMLMKRKHQCALIVNGEYTIEQQKSERNGSEKS